MSCNIDGKDITKERDLSKIANSDPVFGLVVFGNTAIFSTWFSAGIHSTLVATRLSWRDETITTLSGSRELFSLVATTQSMQPPSEYKQSCLPLIKWSGMEWAEWSIAISVLLLS